MDSVSDKTSSLLDVLVNGWYAMLAYLPTALVFLFTLVMGWLVAVLARRALRKIGLASNQWLRHIFPGEHVASERRVSLMITLVTSLVYWAIIFTALSLASHQAEMGLLAQGMDRITAHLPHLITGVLIVVVAYVMSVIARERVAAQLGSAPTPAGLSPGGLVQAVILSFALIIALNQVGVQVALLIGLAIVIVASLLMAVAVAFALGAKTYVSNLIGARTARANLTIGLTIRIGEFHGEVVELTPTLIALETNKGKVLVPARLVDELPITVVSAPADKEGDHD